MMTTALLIPFSQRELAYKAYWFVVCMGRGNLLGPVDMSEVWRPVGNGDGRAECRRGGAQRAAARAVLRSR